jgi:hypothetical protein
MFTAKIQSKTLESGLLTVTVNFTDGVESRVESCVPQNLEGLKYWIKSRLETLNSGVTIAPTLVEGQDFDVSDPVVTPPTLTQAGLDKIEWFQDYHKWLKIKTTLIDTGIVLESQTQVANLKAKVQTNFKPAYLADI